MKKYILISSIVASMLIGCGGGGSKDASTTTNTTQHESKKTQDSVPKSYKDLPLVDKKPVFTNEYLNGKSFYMTSNEGIVKKVTFRLNDFSIEKVARSLQYIPYTITKEGYIKFTKSNNEIFYIKILKGDDEKLSLVSSQNKEELKKVEKANEYFYFVKQKAFDFIGSIKKDKNVSTGFKFTSQWLDGKTLYGIDLLDDGSAKVSTTTFTKTQISRPEGAIDYTVKDGNLHFYEERRQVDMSIRPVENDNDKITYYFFANGVKEVKGWLFYDEQKAREFVKTL